MFSKNQKREVTISNSTMVSLETAKKALQQVFDHSAFTLIDSYIVFHKRSKEMAIKKSMPSAMSGRDLKKLMTGVLSDESCIGIRILESQKNFALAVDMSVRVKCNSKTARIDIRFTIESSKESNWCIVPGSSIDMYGETLPWYGAGFFYEKDGVLRWNKIHGSLNEVQKIAPKMQGQPHY